MNQLMAELVKLLKWGKAQGKIETKPASALKVYWRAGHVGDERFKIKPEDLVEVRMWVYKGELVVAYSEVEVDEREDATVCDSCGARVPADYCTRNIDVMKSNGTTRVETWCNHCRMHSEQPRIKDTSQPATCNNCEKVVCEFHPRHEHVLPPHTARSVVAMLPAARSSTNIPPNVPLPQGWTY